MRQCAGFEVIQRTIATKQRTFHLPTDPSRPRACNSLIQTRKLAHEDKIFELLGMRLQNTVRIHHAVKSLRRKTPVRNYSNQTLNFLSRSASLFSCLTTQKSVPQPTEIFSGGLDGCV